ncbi:MAG: hypothetical protein M5U09_26710 [Gammaproteobacteria bacterium]|nr:hypothetical protein [Gammaproteobacteria bacterium]
MGFLLRAGGLSPTTAAVGGIATLAWPTEANQVVVEWICTRSEVLCGLCSVWAAVVLLGFLDDGGRSRLAGVGGLLLLAYLSKEMALGVALALMAIALTAPAPWRRRLAAMAAVGAVSVLWLVLFEVCRKPDGGATGPGPARAYVRGSLAAARRLALPVAAELGVHGLPTARRPGADRAGGGAGGQLIR